MKDPIPVQLVVFPPTEPFDCSDFGLRAASKIVSGEKYQIFYLPAMRHLMVVYKNDELVFPAERAKYWKRLKQ